MYWHYPQRAPGLFEHISDVSAVARSFGGMAWRYYDECFRRDVTTHSLSFGQVHLGFAFPMYGAEDQGHWYFLSEPVTKLGTFLKTVAVSERPVLPV